MANIVAQNINLVYFDIEQTIVYLNKTSWLDQGGILLLLPIKALRPIGLRVCSHYTECRLVRPLLRPIGGPTHHTAQHRLITQDMHILHIEYFVIEPKIQSHIHT